MTNPKKSRAITVELWPMNPIATDEAIMRQTPPAAESFVDAVLSLPEMFPTDSLLPEARRPLYLCQAAC